MKSLDISKWVKDNRMDEFDWLSKEIEMMDDFTLSIQASSMHYCSPRAGEGPWTHFECGFPSEKEELIMEYIEEDEDKPTDTIYPHVPENVIQKIIEKHGGLKNEATKSKM